MQQVSKNVSIELKNLEVFKKRKEETESLKSMKRKIKLTEK